MKRITIVDWDKTVSETVLTHIPEIRELRTQEDPRVIFREVDVAQLLPKAPERSFDVIFEDLTEVETLEQTVPEALNHLCRMLKPGGALVAQAGELTLAERPLKALAETLRRVRRIFSTVWVFGVHMDSFSYTQAFLAAWASDPTGRTNPGIITRGAFVDRFDVIRFSQDRVFYDSDTHAALFALDPALKDAIGF